MKTTLVKMAGIVILSLLSFVGSTHQLDQPKQTNDPVVAPIYALFAGMREHNKEKILAQFTATARLDRVNKDGSVTSSDLNAFATQVAAHSDYLDEHLLAVIVQQQSGLASVWTPFAFYRNKQLSHCGSNSFQLVKVKEKWQIHYLVDVTYTGDCAKFVAQHSAKR